MEPIPRYEVKHHFGGLCRTRGNDSVAYNEMLPRATMGWGNVGLAKTFLTLGNRSVTVTVWLRIVEDNAILSSGQSPIQLGEKSSAFSAADIGPLAGLPKTSE